MKKSQGKGFRVFKKKPVRHSYFTISPSIIIQVISSASQVTYQTNQEIRHSCTCKLIHLNPRSTTIILQYFIYGPKSTHLSHNGMFLKTAFKLTELKTTIECFKKSFPVIGPGGFFVLFCFTWSNFFHITFFNEKSTFENSTHLFWCYFHIPLQL